MRNGASPAAGRAGADISNWRTLPFSRWAFQNADAIIPCAAIENALGNLQPLAVALRSLDQFRLASQDGSALNLSQFLKATATDGLCRHAGQRDRP
jgi:hypothetical protein